MRCPRCRSDRSSVIRTITVDGDKLRTRQCRECSCQWTTVEIDAGSYFDTGGRRSHKPDPSGRNWIVPSNKRAGGQG